MIPFSVKAHNTSNMEFESFIQNPVERAKSTGRNARYNSLEVFSINTVL